MDDEYYNELMANILEQMKTQIDEAWKAFDALPEEEQKRQIDELLNFKGTKKEYMDMIERRKDGKNNGR